MQHRKNMMNAFQRLLDTCFEYEKFAPLKVEDRQTMLDVHAVLTECKKRVTNLVMQVADYPQPDIPPVIRR